VFTGKCSHRRDRIFFFEASPNCGRSLRLRRREAFDSHAVKATDGRRASKCEGKWPDQPPPPPFGPPGVAAVVRAASLACQNAVKAQKFVPLQESSEESRLKRDVIERPGVESVIGADPWESGAPKAPLTPQPLLGVHNLAKKVTESRVCQEPHEPLGVAGWCAGGLCNAEYRVFPSTIRHLSSPLADRVR
jgi:hypothetical protein